MPYKDKEKRNAYKAEWDKNHPENVQKRGKNYRKKNKKKLTKDHLYYMNRNPEKVLLYAAKQRARMKNLPFSLVESDIVIPSICPVLGIPIARGHRNYHDNSPTIDQWIPGKGYTKENIIIMSFRANRLKNNASIDELEKLIYFLKRETEKRSSISL